MRSVGTGGQMVTPPDETTADPYAVIAALRAKLDAALAREAALARALDTRTVELDQRNNEYSERITHQAATIDVLKAMSASPGDAQPVFDLIVVRARDLCDAYGLTAFEYRHADAPAGGHGHQRRFRDAGSYGGEVPDAADPRQRRGSCDPGPSDHPHQ